MAKNRFIPKLLFLEINNIFFIKLYYIIYITSAISI